MTEDTPYQVTRVNYVPLAERLDAIGLITPRATEEHANLLCNRWQMPMYELEFKQIEVPLEELLSERDAQMAAGEEELYYQTMSKWAGVKP